MTITRTTRIDESVVLDEDVNAPRATDWVKLTGAVALQLTGSATSITAEVQRSTRNPKLATNASPNTAKIDTVTGNPSTGIEVLAYREAAVAWWRINVTAIAGGSVVVSLSGGG